MKKVRRMEKNKGGYPPNPQDSKHYTLALGVYGIVYSCMENPTTRRLLEARKAVFMYL